ncbi:MAG: DinB family protein [Thermoanaerobaculia bacterium]
MRSIEQFLAFLARQRRWTRALVAAVPEEHFEWRPAPAAFSCGELVRHMIQADLFWARMLGAAARGEVYDPFRLAGDAEQRMSAFREPNLESSRRSSLGSSFGELLTAWDSIEEKVRVALGEVTEEQIAEVEMEHPLTRFRGRLWELLLMMLSHEAHHRGQLSAYLKVLRVETPASLFGS